MSSTFSGDETAPFFGFLGAAAALVVLMYVEWQRAEIFGDFTVTVGLSAEELLNVAAVSVAYNAYDKPHEYVALFCVDP